MIKSMEDPYTLICAVCPKSGENVITQGIPVADYLEKRPIEDRPAEVTTRKILGHWEGDTVLGRGRHHCSGTNENRNGIIRQCLPKRKYMSAVSQRDCNWIAKQLNTRPRKRHNYATVMEVF